MGLYLSKYIYSVFSSFSASNPASILMLGLDAAGKTTVLYKIKLNETVITIPTIGFNVETVSPCKGVSFTVWDIGGQAKIRQLWRHYYRSSDALLYIVDSADQSRIAEAKEELFGVLESEEMRDKPVVVMANKQDMPGAMSPAELTDKLGLPSLHNRKWYIHGTCASKGDGIYESMDQLSQMVNEYKNKGR